MAIRIGIPIKADDIKECDFNDSLVSIHIREGLMHYVVTMNPDDVCEAAKKIKTNKNKH